MPGHSSCLISLFFSCVSFLIHSDSFIDLDYMVYMAKYDSTHGQFKGTIEIADGKLVINGHAIAVHNCLKPEEVKQKQNTKIIIIII